MKLLFSAVGTSDPARGCYDGPLLHIIRHYRPDIVYVLVTPEIQEYDDKDHRFRRVEELIQTWDGNYRPTFILRHIATEDPSNMDAIYLPIKEEYENILEQYGEYELLFNLSSATPQMKFILYLLSLDMRAKVTPIQVKEPTKSSGKSKRTNADDYNVVEELELAEMNENEPTAEIRCKALQMSVLKREMERAEIQTSLKRRDYAAVLNKKLPKTLKLLIEHLYYRNNLQKTEALQKAYQLKRSGFPIELYPIKKVKDVLYPNAVCYDDVMEYFLMMKNMQIGNRYSDFLLRLNPFSLALYEKAIDYGMRKKYGKSFTDIRKFKGRKILIDVQKVAKEYPELKKYYEKTATEETSRLVTLDTDEKSPHNYHILVGFFAEELGTELTETLNLCYQLYAMRNEVAHELENVSENDIRKVVNISSAELVKRLENVIAQLYLPCDTTVFDIYERCNAYICEKLF